MGNPPQPQSSPGRVWMRCWIIACLMLVAAQFLFADKGGEVRYVMQYLPRLIGGACGLVLFVSSLFCFSWDRPLACWGIVASIPAMLLPLLPTLS